MQKLKIWGWDKKERTMIRFIKNGDIFCFKMDENRYCFGRIIAKVDFGRLAEIFDYMSDKPCISEEDIEKAVRLIPLVVLDSYSLFDRKLTGEWRIIGRQEDYTAPDFDNIYLTFGVGNNWKIKDLYGNITRISPEEHLKYIPASPLGDYLVKSMIQQQMK